MATEQVRIDLVASDQASDVIADVAADVKALEGLDAEVTVEADTRAAKQSVDELIGNVSKLDGESATVVLAVRAAQVQRELTDVLTDVEQLDAADPTISIKLDQANALAGDLDKLGTQIRELNGATISPDVDTTGVRNFATETGKAQGATHSFVGNAVAELPGVSSAFGPLGEAASQMTEGLLAGEISLGQLAAAAGPIAGVAVAVKVITAALAASKKRAEEARKAVEGWRKALEDVGDGDQLDAIESKVVDLIKGNDDFRDSLEAVGLTGRDVADGLDGKLSPALEDVVRFQEQFNTAMAAEGGARARAQTSTALEDLAAKYGLTTDALIERAAAGEDVLKVLKREGVAFGTAKGDLDQTTRLTKGLGKANETAAGQIEGAADAIEHSNEALDDMVDKLDIEDDVRDLGGALVEQMTNAKNKVKGTADQISDLKHKVAETAKDFNRSPLEVQTALEAVDRGDFAAVWNMVQGWMNQQPLHQPVTLDVKIDRSEIADFLSAQGLTLTANVGPAGRSAGPTVNVTQIFPRGFRPASVVAEAQAAARRNGGLYRRALR